MSKNSQWNRTGVHFIERRYRVGIRNESSIVIPNVRVVLESVEYHSGDEISGPTPEHPLLIEHALNVMGLDDKHGRVDVAPNDRPTAFVDVIAQTLHDDESGDWMSPCYASGHYTTMFTRGKYVFGLRADGGGTFSRSRFVIEATLEDRRIRMLPYNP
jgi:hypothetical protein